MYCPNCAAPIDGVKFCRSCGSNVSLVQQAMSGQLPQSDDAEGEIHWGHRHHKKKDRKKEPSIEAAITEFFTGIGFVIAAIAILVFVPSGVFWWWSMLIPAFAVIGEGLGKYLRWREHRRKQASLKEPGNRHVDYYQSPAQASALSAPTTSELVKPSSVTEHTTRHLESSPRQE
jgi:hypothetical protein